MQNQSVWNNFKELWCNLKDHFLSLLIFWITVVVLGIYFFATHPIISQNVDPEIKDWIAFASFATSLSVALVVWLNFPYIQKKQEAEFLLHIDEKWDKPENIKARMVLQELFLKHPQGCGCAPTCFCSKCQGSGCCSLSATRSGLILQAGKSIITFSQDKTEAGIENFVHLLVLLNFMETIGFLCREKHVTAQKLDALCGASIRENYLVFESYIRFERERRQDKTLFSHFEFLYNQLKDV